jgi:hypothetical protein
MSRRLRLDAAARNVAMNSGRKASISASVACPGHTLKIGQFGWTRVANLRSVGPVASKLAASCLGNAMTCTNSPSNRRAPPPAAVNADLLAQTNGRINITACGEAFVRKSVGLATSQWSRPHQKIPAGAEALAGRELQCPHDLRPSHPRLPDRQSMQLPHCILAKSTSSHTFRFDRIFDN